MSDANGDIPLLTLILTNRHGHKLVDIRRKFLPVGRVVQVYRFDAKLGACRSSREGLTSQLLSNNMCLERLESKRVQ